MNNTPTPRTNARWEKLCCSDQSWYQIAEEIKLDCRQLETELAAVTEQRDELLNFVQKSIPRHTLACVSQPEPQTSPWTFHMDDKGKPIITEDSCVCSPEVKAIRRLLKDGKGFNTARIAAVKGGADE